MYSKTVGVCGVGLCLMSGWQAAGASNALQGAFSVVHSGVDLLLPEQLKGNDTRIRLGMGFGSLPDYAGAESYRLKFLPLVDVRYKKRWRLTFNQLSYSVIASRNGWEAGPLLRYKSGRKEARHMVLEGLGDIKPTLELGGFAKYRADKMLLDVSFRQSLGAKQGTRVKVTAGHGIYESGNLALAAAVEATWLSKQAMQTKYGVTASQAFRSGYGLAEFAAGSSVSKVTANILLRYKVTERYRLLGLASYGRLVGAAAASPLVSGGMGSSNQFKVGVGFTIDF